MPLILHNPHNLLHKLTSKPHPQRPERITKIINYLKQTEYSKFLSSYDQTIKNLKIDEKQIDKATQQQIILLHGQRYYDFIEGMWCEGLSKPQMFINVDTYYMKETFKSAFQAAKTLVLAVQANLKHQQNDIVCLVRPPGHHSGMKNQPHGFSFFNNVAIGANYFSSKTQKKTVIIDWDIHHGQGTQNIFYKRSDVLYISLHRFDNGTFFPHIKQSGPQFMGQKDGLGFNVNICWNFPKPKTQKRSQSETVGDQEYIYCFQNIIIPILRQYDFEAIFVSCGFDCAHGDPIGDSKLTKIGFKYMTKALKQFKKPVFVVLEGGYNIQTLKWGVQAVVEGLNQQSDKNQTQKVKIQQLNEFAQKDIETALDAIKKYWKI